MVEHKTVGQISKELQEKPDEKQPLMDTSKEMLKKYIPAIQNLVTTSECKDWTDPFYIEVRVKREKLLVNVIRPYYFARKTMPCADYEQDVWKYFPTTSSLKYLWSVPTAEIVNELIVNEPYLSKDDKELCDFCKMFRCGKLEEVQGE